MHNIEFTGWNNNFQKIPFIRLLFNFPGSTLSLKEAKNIKDKIVDGEKIIIPLTNIKVAKKILTEASKLGVKCHLIN